MKLLSNANGNITRTDEERQQMIEEGAKAYGEFLTAMGFDWKVDDNSRDTPRRYAKSFVDDLILGSISEEPNVTSFENSTGYDGLVLQKNIPFSSLCSHHHREISGAIHIAYIPGKKGKVIGLSKLNRIAIFYAKRLQIQEGMTQQIHQHIDRVCEKNRGVAVIVEATHGCVKCRQLHHDSTMITSKLSGYFFDNAIGTRVELFDLLNR